MGRFCVDSACAQNVPTPPFSAAVEDMPCALTFATTRLCLLSGLLSVEVSLSKTPNPQIAPDELVGTLHGSQSPLVCECVCEWVNERHKLYSALDKGAI